jgi:hypothetical protein
MNRAGLDFQIRRVSGVTPLLLTGWLAWLAVVPTRADSTFVYAVQLSAAVQADPPAVTLSWEPDPFGATTYSVYRKGKQDTSWGAAVAVLPGSALSYADTAVSVGVAYEYQVVKAATLPYHGYGYLFSGIQVPPTENRGTVLLVVATNSTLGLDFEVSRLKQDLVGDGWRVAQLEVSSNDTPENVHSAILGTYWTDPGNVNTVFLLGHVPILQSGFLDYDGHGARAMPADAYYGDVSYDWPTAPSSSPSYLPSDVTLMVGRVDLANMPGQASSIPWPSETELLRNYLNKDHAWRMGNIVVARQALMGNRRGDEGGLATAASGYRNFEPLVGPGNTIEANIQDSSPQSQRWSLMLASGSYLWAYGCGAGQDTAVGFLGTHGVDAEAWSIDLVNWNAQAVFVMLFGSHLGNWDRSDNILRAVLATPGVGLASFMSGEPHWFCHHLGLGETIGYSTRLTLNNDGLYQSQMNPYRRAVYIALMGDPTLRMEPVPGPGVVSASAESDGVHLAWAAANPSGAEYFVYRAPSPDGPFTRLNGTATGQTQLIDAEVAPGSYTYVVRAMVLTTNPSGSYFNLSQGSFVKVSVPEPPPPPPPPKPFPLSFHLTSAGLVLTWPTQSGITYHVEANTPSLGSSWTNVSGALAADGSPLVWTDSAYSSYSEKLFRVVSP